MRTVLKILILLAVLHLTNGQPACYVSCQKQGCLPSNSQACTSCDVGTILINQRCATASSQSVTML